jgi:hypothetical protein
VRSDALTPALSHREREKRATAISMRIPSHVKKEKTATAMSVRPLSLWERV